MEDGRSEEMCTKITGLRLDENRTPPDEPPALPNELIEEIVAQLPRRAAVLKNCALVGRAWATPCRARLFAHLTVYPRAYPTTLSDPQDSLASSSPPAVREQLAALLAMPAMLVAAPDIAENVRILTVQMMRLPSPSDRSSAAQAAVKILHMLPRLHTLTLDARHLDYPDFSPTLQSTLCGVLNRPSLSALHLREQDVTDVGVHALLSSARHLRRLSIWPRPLLYVRLDGDDVPPFPHDFYRPQLAALHLVGPFDAALAWASAPHCPLDLRALRSLSLSPRRAFDMGGAFTRFAAAHGKALCDVWTTTNEPIAGVGLAFLEHMPALRVVRVRDRVLAPWSLRCVTELLEMAVRVTRVETFELRVAIWPAAADVDRRREFGPEAPPIRWREVDRRLCRLRESHSLKRIRLIAIPREEANHEDAERLRGWVAYCLPEFTAAWRDVLHFDAVEG
ncbi:hypothetical protein BD626DRAFT_512033, partial [Schizophyllum amplum]